MKKKETNKSQQENPVVIETELKLEPLNIIIDNKSYFIGATDVDFFNKLISLPAYVKIVLMGLTPMELQQYIDLTRTKLIELITARLKKNLHFRDTGDPYVFEQDHLPEFKGLSNLSTLIRKVRTKKNRFSLQQLYNIEAFYTGSDFYDKEEGL